MPPNQKIICPSHDKLTVSPATQLHREAAPAHPILTGGRPASLLLENESGLQELPEYKSGGLPALQFIPISCSFHLHLNSVQCIPGNQVKSKSHVTLDA